ncbi:MAG: SPOR domain-containing protein [Candidatus Cloacimonadaceae bacterium]|jgi:tetratricopeptide (TPR) repeat protein|nr:SPOR domain-containing protein [Candidatus Cloacimonadota bacterium]MDY0380610.1 SPOR domain-containing protein [Candidatus Cloacimonadaceae bacterium]MDD2615944.1 SPOR domain-containing protein [Candidatus Cloacimonadota bacterium]MDD2718862.1 SPOR domain-containing protein [Candidatus Cloacimonadota bacterium]MDD3547046.1 SPOR domain-containing protein [Candidatus Cloacimonadota bacterium]
MLGLRVFLSLLLLSAISLGAQIRKDFRNLEKLFDEGKISELQRELTTLKPNKDDERALMLYYDAMLSTGKSDALSKFNTCVEQYPKTLHGQLAMLEAAKIHILEREMQKAGSLLRRINSPDIVERFYWSAVVFYWLDDYSAAIANAENYIRLSPKGKEVEPAHYLVVESYLNQRKYQSAISSLSKIRHIKAYDRQYYHYKLGMVYELNSNAKEALKAYREGYELDKYSQVAFNIEERLFAMRGRAPSLDLSFLYPYTPLDIPVEIASDSLDTELDAGTEVTEEPNLPDLPPIGDFLPVKLIAKPLKGFFLQAGRFSVETNAERLCHTIREMKVPASYYEDKAQGKTTWVVLAGPFSNREQTDGAKARLINREINSFIVQY